MAARQWINAARMLRKLVTENDDGRPRMQYGDAEGAAGAVPGAAGRGHHAVVPISADAAMRLIAARQWSEAARMLHRLLTDTEADNGGLWMQYGHALKEAGLLGEAGRAYERASTLLGATEDVLLQLGHWNKVVGRFEAAEAYYRAARSCGPEDAASRADFDRLVAPLQRLRPPPAPEPTQEPHIFFSSASKLGLGSAPSRAANELGRAHYSYTFAMRGFQRAADELGLTWSFLPAPHYVPDAHVLTGSQRPIHLAFYPVSQARLLKGACNILIFAWEFPFLPLEAEWAHAFSNPRHMLGLFEEVWVLCRYAAAVVGRYTDRPVRVVSSPILPPNATPDSGRGVHARLGPREAIVRQLARVDWVPLAIFPRLQPNFDNYAMARSRRLRGILPDDYPGRRPKIFLSVFNPHDRRKQILPMLQGFLAFARTEPDSMLLLKTTSPIDTNGTINHRLLGTQVAAVDRLTLPLVSERVWITNTALSDAELAALYSLADFYLCTSYCEGQNLPVLEAMAHGTVPVSPCHTAMADYLDDRNAVVIPHTLADAPMILQETYRLWGAQTHLVATDDVAAALEAACRLGPEELQAKVEAATATVRRQFGSANFEQAILRVVGEPCTAQAGA